MRRNDFLAAAFASLCFLVVTSIAIGKPPHSGGGGGGGGSNRNPNSGSHPHNSGTQHNSQHNSQHHSSQHSGAHTGRASLYRIRGYNSWSQYSWDPSRECYFCFCPEDNTWYYWNAQMGYFLSTAYLETYVPTPIIRPAMGPPILFPTLEETASSGD